MLFNSIDYVLFLLLVVLVYRALPVRPQNLLLLVASYFFYGYWDWRFLSLVLVSTVVDYLCGLGIAASENRRRRKRFLLSCSLAANLGLLAYFKYFNFFVDSFIGAAARLGFDLSLQRWEIVLPIGISFYTFQTLSYTIDVYRGKTAPTRQLLDFALYVAFFPQLVAGPIERSFRLLPQIQSPRRFEWADLSSGARRIGWGLFKKVVIADNMGRIVDPVFATGGDLGGTSAAMVWVALYAFAIQIYCDFSGYSDIAIGSARLLGFRLMENFNIPYIAQNPREFWQRWHISLSTWLRDYLYVPLGGNRRGARRTYVNLMITMLFGGLWHGAAWTFVVWGAIHGAWLALHRAATPLLRRVVPEKGGKAVGVRVAAVVLSFHVVCVTWLFFRANSLDQALGLLASFAHNWSAPTEAARALKEILLLCGPLLLVKVSQIRTNDPEAVGRWPLPLRWGFYALVFNLFLIAGVSDGAEFIYFQF